MMLSPGFIHVAAHPEHGMPVEYVPGQALPAWLEELLVNGATLRPVTDRVGEFDLVLPKRPMPRNATSAKKVTR